MAQGAFQVDPGLLFAQVRAPQHRVAALERALCVRRDPLGLSDPEARRLYEPAGQYAAGNLPPHAESFWVDTLDRLRHEDLLQLERVVDDRHPWKPLYTLGALMVAVPFDGALRDELAAVLASLRDVAEVWCQVRGLGPREIARLLKSATPRRRLIRSLERAQQVGRRITLAGRDGWRATGRGTELADTGRA